MLLGACVTHRKTIKFAANSLSEHCRKQRA